MALLSVEGIYKDGKVELTETPKGVKQARVVVTFLAEGAPATGGQPMRHGQFAGAMMSTDEDFRAAEWRGDAELTHGS